MVTDEVFAHPYDNAPDSMFEQFFNLASGMMAVATFDGRFVLTNDAWERTLGWSKDQMQSRPFLSFVHPDDVEETEHVMAAMVADGTPVSGFENRYRCADGTYRWLSWFSNPDMCGQFVHAVAHDITEHRRDRHALTHVETVTGVGTWELEVGTDRLILSDRAFAIYASDRESFVGRRKHALRPFPEPARTTLDDAIGRAVTSGVPFHLELPFAAADGKQLWVLVSGHPHIRNGVVIRVGGIIQDVTDQHEKRATLARYRYLVRLSEEGIVETAADGTVVYANSRAKTILRGGADVAGTSLSDHIQVGTCAQTFDISQLPPNSETLRFQTRTTDGGMWVQIAARLSRDEREEPAGWVIVVTDISVQKKYEQDLEFAQERLEMSQQAALIGGWSGNVETLEMEWEPYTYKMFGKDPATFEPSFAGFLDLVADEHRELVEQRILDVASSHGHDRFHSTHDVVLDDGTRKTVHQIAIVRNEPDGRRAYGTIQDITAIKANERALRESESRLQRVLHATNDGWWDTDLTTGVTFESDRLAEIHGYVPGELPTDPQQRAELVHPDDRELFVEAFVAATRRGVRTFDVATRVLHKDGQHVPVRMRTLVEYDRDGVPVRLSGATTDMSETFKAEQAKREFLSVVSHELRTPLTSIKGSVELIRAGAGGPVPAPMRRLVDMAERNTARLEELIDNLLSFERLSIGNLPFAFETEPVVDFVEEVLQDFSPAGVDVHHRAEVGRHVTAEFDRRRLGQVLNNLLSNAQKFAPSGSSITVRTSALDDQWVRVEVADQGEGVPQDFDSRIFERFEQADSSNTRSQGGTGLGLAISREIVERHEGRIGYTSEPGDTVFHFDIRTGPRKAYARSRSQYLTDKTNAASRFLSER